jgi:hypothetical protein
VASLGRQPWAAFVAAIVVLSACTPAGSTPSLAPTSSPQTGTSDCPNIDLRSPSGERVALTGTWVTEREGARSGVYFVHQVGECVWFAGSFPWPGDASHGPLGFVTVVFRGRVRSDFSITGDWIDVRQEGLQPVGLGGSISLEIEFGEHPGEIRLVYVSGTGQPFVEPGYREEQSWIKISEGGAYPPPTPAP